MALLLEDREASAEAAAPQLADDVAPVVADFACEICGAGMERGQDWCLECGTAAPGRLGSRPGWRAATTVVGLTLLLLCSAVVASYAALTSDAQRSAAQPSTGSADPIVAQTPGVSTGVPPATTGVPVQPGVTGPGVAAPTPPAGTKPIIPTTLPPAGITNLPVTPPPPVVVPTTPGTGTGTGTTGTGTTTAPAAVAAIVLKKDAAATYDPNKRAGAEFGPAKNAVDGKPNTVWDVVVPADGRPLGVGLLLNLGAAYDLQSLRIGTPTQGFKLELYGAVDDKEIPLDVIDKRWVHLTNSNDVVDGKAINLKGKGDGKKFKLLLLYFTQPGEPTDPRVAVGDLDLRGTA